MSYKPTLILLLCFPGITPFAEIIYAPIVDAQVQKTLSTPPLLVIDETSAQLIAGCNGSVGKGLCSIIPIQLPEFGAADNLDGSEDRSLYRFSTPWTETLKNESQI